MRGSSVVLAFFMLIGVTMACALVLLSDDPYESRVEAQVSEVQKKVEEYDKICDGYKDKLDQCMTQLRFCRGVE